MTGQLLIEQNYEMIQKIIDCIKVGIYIADTDGKTLMVNRESEKTGGMSREELVGKNMKDLLEMGYVDDSSILRVCLYR